MEGKMPQKTCLNFKTREKWKEVFLQNGKDRSKQLA
jgi:hypothetical protein